MRKRMISVLLLLLMLVSLTQGLSLTAYGASALKSSAELIQIIKTMEGFKSKPYWDNGHWAIGYGTTCPDDKVDTYKSTGITVAQAEEMLKTELVRFENAVNGFADKYTLTLQQQQFDALVSFTYNCGEAWMSETTGYFNNAIRDQVTGTDLIYSMALYSGAAGSYPLIKRRLCEANMYLNGVYKAYNESNAVPSDYKYVYLDGNGGDVRYVICAFDANDKAPIDVEFKNIPTGKDSAGNTFVYSLAGWYTAEGKKVTALDSTLKNGQVLYARWADNNGNVKTLPKGERENLTVTVTGDSVNVRKGPGTFYDKVTTYSQGTKVTLTQTYEVGGYTWGKTDKGWFLLDYSDYEIQKAAQVKFPRQGFVTTDNVNVRTGPGTEYSRVTQMHKGDAVTIHEIRTGGSYQWGRLDSGNWICMDYVMYAEEGSIVKAISVHKLPAKTEYLQNKENLDLRGSVLLLTYHDGSASAMTLTRATVSGFSNAKLGTVTVSVSYEGCATSFQVTVIKDCATGHTWNSGVQTSAPTCTQAGKTTYTCAVCAETKTEDIPALGHSWGEWTDTAEDTHSRTCSRNCGVAAQTGTHSWSDWTKVDGEDHKKTCSVCDGVRTESHRLGNWQLQSDGSYIRKCVCSLEETLHLDQPVNVTPADNGAAMTLDNTDIQLVEKLFTDAEQARAVTGERLQAWLEAEDISDTVAEPVKNGVQTKAGSAQIGMYLNMELFKQTGEETPRLIPSIASPVSVSLTVPEAMRNTDEDLLRSYRIIRAYEDKNGNVITDVIRGNFDPENNRFTFQTDRSAVYALVFLDRPAGLLGDINGDGLIDTEDAVSLLLHISMPQMFPLEDGTTGDFTDDGLITTDDAVLLLLHVSMPEMFPL